MSNPDMMEKALRRLVEAVTYPETDMNRIEMMEHALISASIALGEDSEADESLIRENLEQLAAQTLIDKLHAEDVSVVRLAVENGSGDELGSIVVTTHPLIGTLLTEQIRSILENERDTDSFDVN